MKNVIKYELTEEIREVDGRTLHRIKALTDIKQFNVKVGDFGGWIESEQNLSHTGDAWVFYNAQVYGDALVYGDASVGGYAQVYGDASVCDRVVLRTETLDSTDGVIYLCMPGYFPINATETHFRIGCMTLTWAEYAAEFEGLLIKNEAASKEAEWYRFAFRTAAEYFGIELPTSSTTQ